MSKECPILRLPEGYLLLEDIVLEIIPPPLAVNFVPVPAEEAGDEERKQWRILLRYPCA